MTVSHEKYGGYFAKLWSDTRKLCPIDDAATVAPKFFCQNLSKRHGESLVTCGGQHSSKYTCIPPYLWFLLQSGFSTEASEILKASFFVTFVRILKCNQILPVG